MDTQREPIMEYFDDVSADFPTFTSSFKSFAEGIYSNIPRNPERTVALRKLLECRDATLRALKTARAEYLANEGKV